MCQSLQLYIEKRPWCWCFHVNFAKFLRTTFFLGHLRWLLQKVCSFFFFRKTPSLVFYKKAVFKTFAKFRRKQIGWGLYFNKAAGLQLPGRCLSVNFTGFLRKGVLQNTSGRLLLFFLAASFNKLYKPIKNLKNKNTEYKPGANSIFVFIFSSNYLRDFKIHHQLQCFLYETYCCVAE